jgi:uncharacterized membrane protein YiaA
MEARYWALRLVSFLLIFVGCCIFVIGLFSFLANFELMLRGPAYFLNYPLPRIIVFLASLVIWSIAVAIPIAGSQAIEIYINMEKLLSEIEKNTQSRR